MTTATGKSAPSPKLDKRGKHPHSLANLRPPWKPGEQPNRGNPYPVSRHLKDLLCDVKNGREVAETMLRTAKLPNSKGYSTALIQLLDRTEGKVLDKHLVAQVDVVFVIGKGYKDAPLVT